MKRMRITAAIVLLSCGLAAAGCGGDDGDKTAAKTTTTSAPLSGTQYIARADRICEANTAKLDAAGAKLRDDAAKAGTLPPREQIVTFLRQTSVPTYERMLAQLRALVPPPDDAGPIDGYLAALAIAIDKVKADPAHYAKASAKDPFDEANTRAKRLGLDVCGS
jgi:hypothetical protein